MSRWGRKQRIPKGFDYLEPTLSALQEELRARTNESHEGKSKAEALWPIHQLNWQRSRYVYDMYYKYKKISREVYQYCLDMKYADAALIAKWKKPGYERLCSTYAINPKNFPYGTVSICRVPRKYLKDKGIIKSNFSGCIGCASGKNGFKNIFGNKYGQRLAKIQILREQAKAKLEEERQEKQLQEERLMKLQQELQQNKAEVADVKAKSNIESGNSTAAPSTWYIPSKEDIEYSDDSSTDEDEEGPQIAGKKRKVDPGSEMSQAEATRAMSFHEKKQKQ